MKAKGAIPVSRRLLGRLRDVMAGGGTAQDRLDKVVKLIAVDMVAEVCSCYVMRAGEVLELFATEGLLKTAVHQTRLRVGEGLVGDIAAHARPLALDDAQKHPMFAYRPETGEEVYHSLVGVPIVRNGRVIGVVVVQNKSRRHYTDEEVETLETVAMVLAELVSSGDLVDKGELAQVDGNALLPLRLEGARLNAGVGIGNAVIHAAGIVVHHLVAENPDTEQDRLRDALARLRRDLDALLESQDMAPGGEHREVLETFRMFADDAGWIARIGEAIRSGLTAEAAVQKVHEDMRVRMGQVTDTYLRERLHDLEDLANRLLKHLVSDTNGGSAVRELPENTILICRTIGPTELLDYDRRKLRGLVLEEGSPTMHVAIVARAFDIPVVGRVKDALAKIEALDQVIVDGDNAQVMVRPSDDLQELFAASLRARDDKRAVYAAMRDLPAVTQCGTEVRLMLNAGLQIDMPQLAATGADGIGLYRTEIPFMARAQLPDVAAQTQLYTRILDQAAGKQVVFRTLDVGSDKLLPYWQSGGEDNPAMGWRSIRITLDRPMVMRQQLRALVAASAGRDLTVMFPMVAEVAEFDRARDVLELELARRTAQQGVMPTTVKVGTMLEVPALAWQIDTLLQRIDFLSIGSNDLTQFMFAIDRGNPRISDRYDVLAPGMLSFLRFLVVRCGLAGKPVSVCGEMAGRPLEAMALLGLGVRTLSMSAPSVGPVKAMVRSVNLPQLEDFMADLLHLPDHSLRERLRGFAIDHGVAI